MTTESVSTRGMIYASLFGALTAIGALVSIPLQPVPVTLQTLFLYLAGSLLGGGLGALSQLIYIVLGVIGLPVFSGGKAGLGVFIGPTGGYLIGFVAGAFVTGTFVRLREKPGLVWIVFAMLAGTAVVYALGVLQLVLIGRLSVEKAAAVGVLPFLPGDALKIAAASVITLKVRDRIRI
ncbi:MAG TPA: biotin transporter BioY [Syntrophales bacterium]|nr:biotin transporter BioY [Syntrophobacterales bacterium]HNQ01287.1 biotin transporter BioY [Syntrophales bacterium]HNS53528.1 biotin transporter BioY [Syntrophales bacterium]HQL90092.1 biotin transporter BioY [Syntrophales bacterium]